MASLIPGFNYDIFISYRQRDNKGDGWVSEFVESLKTELESTFKEDISVYIDINTHDGLLETHDVGESLKEKLKCLVFIPIVSRTYCDPKSFAWQHEFKAFVELASKDQFGLKVKLPNGNVASRVLPVQIHELESADKKLVENELGGFLRAVELIYKEPGVNKPLSSEDDERRNLNKTIYRIQVNKVANSIKEIISALQNNLSPKKEEAEEAEKPLMIQKSNPWFQLVLACSIIILMIILGKFLLKKYHSSSVLQEKSIAVLPFRNDSSSDSTSHFIDGLMEEIMINLQTIKELKVPGRTSVEQYRNSLKPISKIAKELDVSYLVEGSGQKYGNTFRLRVQLIEAQNDRHIWAESYEEEIKNTSDIFRIQSAVAQTIASELKAKITPIELQQIGKIKTQNLNALYYYQKGMTELSKRVISSSRKGNILESESYNKEIFTSARKYFNKALELDSTFAQAYAQIARLSENKDTMLTFSNKALSFDYMVAEAYFSKGLYYSNSDKKKAIEYFEKASEFNPNWWEPYYNKANILENDDWLESIVAFEKASSLNHDSQYSDLLFRLSWEYLIAGFPDRAENVALETIKLDGDSLKYFQNSGLWQSIIGNNILANELFTKSYYLDSLNTWTLRNLGKINFFLRRYGESYKYYKKYYALISGNSLPGEYRNELARFAYSCLKVGSHKEAEESIDFLVKTVESSIQRTKNFRVLDYFQTYYHIASVYAIRGDREKMYKNLSLFSTASYIQSSWISFLKNDRWFDAFRNEPEFQKIEREVENIYQKAHKRTRIGLERNGLL